MDATDSIEFAGRAYQLLIVIWVLTGAGTLLLLMWAYARFAIKPSGGWALFWASLYWLLLTLASIFATVNARYGLGSHLEQVVRAGVVREYLLNLWLSVFFFVLSMPVGKIAVCAILLAFINQTHRITRAILMSTVIVNVIVVIPNFIMVWVHCKPASAILDPLRQGQCNFEPVQKYWYMQGATWAVTDLIQVAIALAIIWPLKISRLAKISLSCLMSLGILAFAITIVRTLLDKAIDSPDPSFDTINLYIWAKSEEWVILLVACAPPAFPTMRLLYMKATCCGFSSPRRKGPQKMSSAYKITKEDRLDYCKDDGLDHRECSGDHLVPPTFELTPPPAVAALSRGAEHTRHDKAQGSWLQIDRYEEAYPGRSASATY